MLTSAPPVSDRYSRRTWWFVYGVWAAMLVQAIIFIVRYSYVGPVIDEWEFIPAVTGEESMWPWLWKLHNEHRFPLPRLIWLPLTQLAGDFRIGCYLSLAGVAWCSWMLTALAVRLRGRLHFADAFFPITLFHAGHWENLRMGYQVVFMMNLVLASILLRLILTTDRSNLLTRGIQAGVVTILLLLCGAGGLAYGPFMAIWFVALAVWFGRADFGPASRWRVAIILALTALIPLYVYIYLQGYHRPSHHDDPVEIWGSHSEAAWQALRSGLQALSTGFGPATNGLWPLSALIISLVGFECLQHMLRVLSSQRDDRPRASGLLLFLGALAFMAYGIGWGRCTWQTPDGQPGFMGLSSRYGWIVWPALAAIYFQWLIYGGPRLSRWIPVIMLGIVIAMLPFNIVTGFQEAEKYRATNVAWEKSVRDGMSDEELIDKYYSNYFGELKLRMGTGLHLLRKHRFQYYRPLDATPPSRIRPRRRRTGFNQYFGAHDRERE